VSGSTSMEAAVTIHIRNDGRATEEPISLLLYRLLRVRQASIGGVPQDFSQQRVVVDGKDGLVANHVVVEAPIPGGDAVELAIEYRGRVEGYADVWAYARDTIGTEFTLLRPDVLVYPIVTDPSLAGVFAAMRNKFDWTLSVTIPDGFVPACGGRLERVGPASNGLQSYTYESITPTWRVDVAVAPYEVIEADGSLEVYFTPENTRGAQRILGELSRVRAFYQEKFGPPPSGLGCRVIQIPEDWGGQAGDGYILQPVTAFTTDGRISHLYHEVAHTWNARPTARAAQTRWFDEAFASYFEALAIEEFQSQRASEMRMAEYRDAFRRAVKRDARNHETPIVDYGVHELGHNSYTKGAWSLHILRRLVGDECFTKLVRRFLAAFADGGADFGEFKEMAEDVTGVDLEVYFEQWIYGAESSEYLVSDLAEAELVRACRLTT